MYHISPNYYLDISTLANTSTPSFWDQENILCLEMKFTKSTDFHLTLSIQ